MRTQTGLATITAIKRKEGDHRVYNFEVEQTHAYFVGHTRTLSHNTDCPVTRNDFYDPHEIRSQLEKKYPGQVTSTTVPPPDAPGVQFANSRNPSGVAYDSRGFPTFDNAAADVYIPQNGSGNYLFDQRAASRELASATGGVNPGQFTDAQWSTIMAGKAKVPDLTWHHHQDLNRMQLVPTPTHSGCSHTGGNAIWQGK